MFLDVYCRKQMLKNPLSTSPPLASKCNTSTKNVWQPISGFSNGVTLFCCDEFYTATIEIFLVLGYVIR